MIGALIYLQMQSIKNRLRMRLRRLKKPTYLAGAAVGGVYFYFFFFRNLFVGRRSAVAAADTASPETVLLLELAGALALFLMVLSVVALLLAAVLGWVKSAVPAPEVSDFADVEALKYYLRHALESGPALYALIPFRLLARPYLAADASAFLAAFIPAAVLLLLHYWWVVRADVAFEEASVEVSRKFAERIAAVRAGGAWHLAAEPKKRKSPPFTLRPTGACAVAFLWKNLISAGHAFTLRTWIFLASFAVCAGLPLGLSSSRKGWLLPALGILTVILTGYSLFLGPAILRQDLRQDLANADILKMYPLRGWQVVLGELLAPAAILTGVQWCLLLLAAAVLAAEAALAIWWMGRLFEKFDLSSESAG